MPPRIGIIMPHIGTAGLVITAMQRGIGGLSKAWTPAFPIAAAFHKSVNLQAV
jgi:hypothetical protein